MVKKYATQKEITEYIMNNLDELSSTDLMRLSRIAKEIVEKRLLLTKAWDED